MHIVFGGDDAAVCQITLDACFQGHEFAHHEASSPTQSTAVESVVDLSPAQDAADDDGTGSADTWHSLLTCCRRITQSSVQLTTCTPRTCCCRDDRDVTAAQPEANASTSSAALPLRASTYVRLAGGVA